MVTGSEGGLGRALCARLRSAGYRVIGIDRAAVEHPGAGAETGDAGKGPACDVLLELDLAVATAGEGPLAELAAPLGEALGSDGVELLVNNAAVQLLGPLDRLTAEEWNTTFATNLIAPALLTRLLLPRLERARGVVIHVGSVHARATKPEFSAYAASKAALAGLTRAMAVELGPRVRVLCVQPAAIETPMLRAGFEGRPEAFERLAACHPLGRIASPEEIAGTVTLLASPEGASFATGAVIDLDGGVLSCLHDPDS